ncbi:MAG: TonB-dependent receptor [Cytophagales bacterium]|nr:TonB-dependent receptor [Bernardetiaceae bacterium]MDW8204096.1 TonB-dependent receptor [Cytophagales bacterium]
MNMTIDRRLWGGIPILLFLLVWWQPVFSQKKVTGKVTDAESNTPLPGVAVLAKGTQTGTTTDSEGKFSLNVPAGSDVLVFSYVGFKTQEIVIGNQTNIEIALQADDKLLSEVVVTGYLTEQKKDIVGSVATVKSKDLVAIPQGNVEQQLQGRVAGVTVLTSGQPGVQTSVRVRGFTTLGNNAPLYIVDGVPLTDVSDLNGLDIESTTVLKDAGSASIYGARASNGVIVMTTKRGLTRPGKVRLDYEMQYGMQYPGKRPPILTPQEQAEWTFRALRNAGQATVHPQYGSGANPVLPDYINVGGLGGLFEGDPRIDRNRYNVNFDRGPIYQIVRANKAGTDWYDELTNPAPILNQSIGLSGGNENSRFYLGLGQYEQQGVVLNTWLKRYTARLNSEFTIAKKLRIGENFQATFRENPNIGNDLNSPQSENDLFMALTINPLIPVYDEFGGWAGTAAPGFNNSRNPVADRTRAGQNRGFSFSTLGNLYAELEPIPNLNLRTSIGGRLGSFHFRAAQFRTYERSENVGANSVTEGGGFFYTWTWTNTATYQKTFLDKHNVKGLIGYEYVVTDGFRQINGFGLNPFSMDPAFRTLSTTETVGRQVNSFGSPERRFGSLFGRVDYNYADKYYFNGTIRQDQSSVFGANNRTGVFPAFSAAWRISSEEFMKGLEWIDDLKIRGGWGQMGNSLIDPNNQFDLFVATSYDISGVNSGADPALRQSRLGNRNARWETTTTTNIGFDGTFFKGKMDIILDLYQKRTDDILYQVPLPAVLGQVTPPSVNIASISNRGIDLQIINRGNITQDLRFETDLTFTTFNNRIESLAPDAGITFFDGGFATRLGSTTRNQVGSSFSRFFGYKVVGLFQNEADVRNSPVQEGAAPGRLKFADINGDGRITPDDRTFIGSPIPDFTMGLNLRLMYKNFEFETFFYWVAGADAFNNYRLFTDFYPLFPGIAISRNVLDSWTPQNPNARTPIFENVANFSTNTQVSSYFIENASYLRNRNMQISYNVPKKLLERVGAERLRVFVQAANLFTITKYTGLDPAISGGDAGFGIDTGGNYPFVRTFMLGASLGF